MTFYNTVKKILIFSFVLLSLCTMALSSQLPSQDEKITDALPEDAKELIDWNSQNTTTNFGANITRIFKEGLKKTRSQLTADLNCVTRIMIIVLCCSVVCTIGNEGTNNAVMLAGVICILTCCTGTVIGMMDTARTTILDIHAFSKILLPIMAGTAFTSGLTTASAALYSGSVLFMQFLLSFIEHAMIPLIYAYIALSACGAVLPNNGFEQMNRFLAGCIKNALKVVMFFYSAYLSLTGLIAGRTDALALKATKLSVSTVVPVIGGVISDASETVLVGSKLLLHSAGALGMLGALAIVIVPFLKIGGQYLLLRIASVFSAVLGNTRHAKFVEQIAKAMGFLTATCCCSSLMVFVSCICYMKAGGT